MLNNNPVVITNCAELAGKLRRALEEVEDVSFSLEVACQDPGTAHLVHIVADTLDNVLVGLTTSAEELEIINRHRG